jgi:hypothetical protein
MTAAWNFKRFTRLFSARNRQAGTIARTVRFRPGFDTIEERTLLSTLAGVHQDPVIGQPGNAPGPSIVADFDGKPDLLTLNAAANDLTLISGYNGPHPVTTTISSDGVDPRFAFKFSAHDGFDDLVVGNAGDGVVALFEGTSKGLVLESSVTVHSLPRATALEFLGVTGDEVRFEVVELRFGLGRESHVPGVVDVLSLVGGNLPNGQPGPNSQTPNGVAQLVPLQESSLALIGTLLPQTVESSAAAAQSYAAELVAAPALETSTASGSLGQSLLGQGIRLATAGAEIQQPVIPGNQPAVPGKPNNAGWQSYMLGTDEALERFDREHPDLSLGGSDAAQGTTPGVAQNEGDPAKAAGSVVSQHALLTASQVAAQDACDHVIDLLRDDDPLVGNRTWWREDTTVLGSEPRLADGGDRLSACLVLTSVGAGYLYCYHGVRQRPFSRGSIPISAGAAASIPRRPGMQSRAQCRRTRTRKHRAR